MTKDLQEYRVKLNMAPARSPYSPRMALEFRASSMEEDAGGLWTPEEMVILKEAVEDMAEKMGGAAGFSAKLGGLNFSRKDMPHRGLTWRYPLVPLAIHVYLRPEPKPKALLAGEYVVNPGISFDKWTVVHEIAHAWDMRSGLRLSRGLERYTGGHTRGLIDKITDRIAGRRPPPGEFPDDTLPGCNRAGYFYGDVPPAGSDRNFNRLEDFAESVTAYVYPEKARELVLKKFGEGSRFDYGDFRATLRWQYVDTLMR